MKNIIYSAAIFLFLTGCDNMKVPEVTITEQENIEEIVITHDQFDTNDFLLGTPEKKIFPIMIETSGMIDVPPENRASITAFMGGFIRKTSLLIGDQVTKGQLLVILENQEFVQMQQDYLEVFNQLDYLKAEFERNKTLYDEKIASQKNYLQAKSNFETTQASYRGLREQLQMLNINPDKVEQGNITSQVAIYAPIAGSITKMNVVRGSFVSPATEILEIVDNNHIHLELTVFEKDILKVKKGQQIWFRIPEASDETFDAEVLLVGTAIDEEKRTIQVHGHPHTDINFLPGMFVEARIMTDTTQSWSLPEEAVAASEGAHYALKLINNENGRYTFKRIAIKPGEIFDGSVKIIAPTLSENDQFLTRGVFTLIGG